MAKKKKNVHSIPIPPKSNPYKGLRAPVNPKNPYHGMTQYKGRLYQSKAPKSKKAKAPKTVPHPQAGTPAAPPASSTPTDTPPSPYDALYTAQAANVDKSTADSLAGLTNQEIALKQSYGIDDTSNPFNKMALLKRSFEQARSRSTNSAGNQLYAGSLQNAQIANQYGFNQNENALRTDYAGRLQQINQRRTDLQNQAEAQRLGYQQDSLNRTLSAGPEDAFAPPDATPAAGGGVSSAAYSRHLRFLRNKYGAGSAQVQAYRKSQGH